MHNSIMGQITHGNLIHNQEKFCRCNDKCEQIIQVSYQIIWNKFRRNDNYTSHQGHVFKADSTVTILC